MCSRLFLQTGKKRKILPHGSNQLWRQEGKNHCNYFPCRYKDDYLWHKSAFFICSGIIVDCFLRVKLRSTDCSPSLWEKKRRNRNFSPLKEIQCRTRLSGMNPAFGKLSSGNPQHPKHIQQCLFFFFPLCSVCSLLPLSLRMILPNCRDELLSSGAVPLLICYLWSWLKVSL